MVPLRLINSTARFYDANGSEMPSFASIHHRNEVLAGFGDVSLSGRVRLLGVNGGPLLLDLSGGVLLPTGNTEPDPFALGAAGKAHQHMFFGNGTFDPQLAVQAVYFSGAWRSTGYGYARVPLVENGYGYRGPRLWNGGVAFDRAVPNSKFRVMVGAALAVEQSATWSGRISENSGRTTVLGRAAVFYLPSADWQWSLGVDVPTVVASVGGQLEMPLMVRLSVSHQVPAPWAKPAPAAPAPTAAPATTSARP